MCEAGGDYYGFQFVFHEIFQTKILGGWRWNNWNYQTFITELKIA